MLGKTEPNEDWPSVWWSLHQINKVSTPNRRGESIFRRIKNTISGIKGIIGVRTMCATRLVSIYHNNKGRRPGKRADRRYRPCCEWCSFGVGLELTSPWWRVGLERDADDVTLEGRHNAYMRLSRRLDRCDRVIQNESGYPFGGNVYYVTMQITLLTRTFRNGERNLHCDVVHVTT